MPLRPAATGTFAAERRHPCTPARAGALVHRACERTGNGAWRVPSEAELGPFVHRLHHIAQDR